MAFGDDLDAVDPQGVLTGLIAEQAPELVQNNTVEPQAVLNRLIRKGLDQRQQRALTQPTTPSPETEGADFSSYGTPVDMDAPKGPDFSSYGTPVDDVPLPKAKPQELVDQQKPGILGTAASVLDYTPTGILKNAAKGAVDWGVRAYNEAKNAPPEVKAKPANPDDPYQIVAGAKAGAWQYPDQVGHSMAGFGDILDSKGLREAGDKLAKVGSEGGDKHKPRVAGLENIRTDSLGNALTDLGSWSGYQLGQGVVSSAASLIGTIVGASAGGAVAGPAGAVIGGAGGSTLPSYVQNYGSVRKEALEDAGIKKLIDDGKISQRYVSTVTAAAAIPMAALDIFSNQKMLGQAFTHEAKEALGKRIVKGLASGAITEGSTEGAQQIIEEWALQYLGSNKTAYDQLKSIINSFAGGAVSGGPIAATAAAIPGKEAPQVQPQAQPQPAQAAPGAGLPPPPNAGAAGAQPGAGPIAPRGGPGAAAQP